MIELALAWQVAQSAHAGQYRRGRKVPYILHIMRVYNSLVTIYSNDHPVAIAGILHDVVEDSEYTLHDLEVLGFSNQVIAIVDAVTKRPHHGHPDADEWDFTESYWEYIDRLNEVPLARPVKIADLQDNINDEPNKGIIEKRYNPALKKILDRIHAEIGV